MYTGKLYIEEHGRDADILNTEKLYIEEHGRDADIHLYRHGTDTYFNHQTIKNSLPQMDLH